MKGLRELHLFAGAGGCILGGMLLGHTCVCAVEIESYRRKVLLQRQRDGILPRFPIWDDVRTFDGRSWRGKVDCVCGGFPCRRFSSAHHGRPKAEDLWPEMFRIVLEIRPRIVFAENVKEAPILTAKNNLKAVGYRCNHGRFDAHFVGAPHSRTRWWLIGNSDLCGQSNCEFNAEAPKLPVLCENIWNESNLAEALRMDDGLAYRLDRIASIGDGQVPAVVRLAWNVLSEGLTP